MSTEPIPILSGPVPGNTIIENPFKAHQDLSKLAEDVANLKSRLENMSEHYKGTIKKVDGLCATKVKLDTFTTEHISLIRRTCCPPAATDEDFKRFIAVAQEYNLDPIKKDMYLIPYKGKMTVVIGRDGYLKIAHTDPAFDGMESDVFYEGDTLVKRPDTSLLITYGPAHFNADSSKIVGAFCNVFRKDQAVPTVIYVSIKIARKDTDTWKYFPAAMMLKTAEVKALRRSFMFGDSDVEEGEE